MQSGSSEGVGFWGHHHLPLRVRTYSLPKGGSVHPPDSKQRVTERQQHRGAWKNRGVLIKSCSRTPIQKLRGTKGMLACKRVNNNTAWCSAHSVTWLRLGAWRLKRNRKFWRFVFSACGLLHRVGAWREMHSTEDMRRMQVKRKKNFVVGAWCLEVGAVCKRMKSTGLCLAHSGSWLECGACGSMGKTKSWRLVLSALDVVQRVGAWR